MRIAIAQINCTVGDFSGNAAKIVEHAERALTAGASLLLTPELALTGYPPEDLLLRHDFYHACEAALLRLATALPDITVVVGHPAAVGDTHFNAASVLQGGRVVATYHKQCLPNHSVFDEVRYFVAGDQPLVFDLQGVRFGVVICADVWESGPIARARDAGAEVILALNASPYHLEKLATRYEVLRDRVMETGLPVFYANLVGGQDELVFDGASFVLDGTGALTHQWLAFEEALGLVDLDGTRPLTGMLVADQGLDASVYQALCLGVRDYVLKNGFPGVLLGLSGGIDSALTLAIAVDALGATRVRAVMMPSEFTADISLTDAALMAGSARLALKKVRW